MKLQEKDLSIINRKNIKHVKEMLLNKNKNNKLEINSFKNWLEKNKPKEKRFEIINGKMHMIFQSKINHE